MQDDIIELYWFSESGHYLVTYTCSSLELWDLEQMTRDTQVVRDSGTGHLIPPHPYACSDPIIQSVHCDPEVSISWDGSQVAVYNNGQLTVYAVDQSRTGNITPQTQPLKFENSANLSLLKQADLMKPGTFHVGTKDGQLYDPTKEMILILDENVVKIFNVHGTWTPLHSICANNLRSIQGRHFASRDDKDRSICVWNIDSGRVVCTVKTDDSPSDMADRPILSGDATLLLNVKGGSLTSYCTATGVPLATNDRSHDFRTIVGGYGQVYTNRGSIVCVDDLIEIHRHWGLYMHAKVIQMSKDNGTFTSTTKDLLSLSQQSWKSNPCGQSCLLEVDQFPGRIYSYIDHESKTRMRFKVEMAKVGENKSSLCVIIADDFYGPRKVILSGVSNMVTTFSPKDRALVVIDYSATRVFKMPTAYSDDPQLVAIQLKVDEKEPVLDNLYGPSRAADCELIKQCRRHGRVYITRSGYSLRSLFDLEQDTPVIPPWDTEDHSMRFINRYINRPALMPIIQDKRHLGVGMPFTIGTTVMTAMEHVCRSTITRDALLEKLLTVPGGRWMPQAKPAFNPMEFFLERAKIDASNMQAFKLFSDYCLHRALVDQNTYFLGAITACFTSLLDPKLPHTVLARSVLRGMAFIPASSRNLIMERHALIHPPEFRFKFWKPNSRPLFKCDDPILQLESLGTKAPINVPGNETFLHEIFAATFNMIWVDDGGISNLSSTSKPAGVPPSIFYWIKMTPFVLLFKLNFFKDRHIKSHDFPLDAYDNPAISALIAYKW
ncbi:hypothetical protein BGZ83_008125 [Gryganskiella cystojenkinii]|nr:hypothetical protein BGZ83_008125 [Gryganskiella cystojenkinii]